MGGRMAGCNPRKCSIDFDPNRDTGCLLSSDPDCRWSCWCLGTCSVIDTVRSKGLGQRAESCSQVMSRPCLSRVLPLALLDGLRETLMRNAVRICDAQFANLALLEGDGFRFVA